MSFVAGQIAVWIVLAFFSGFAIGWLARSRGRSRTTTPTRRRIR